MPACSIPEYLIPVCPMPESQQQLRFLEIILYLHIFFNLVIFELSLTWSTSSVAFQ
jgi:hypothetical protein